MSKPSKNFVHLHVHSEYSLLDGLSRIDELVQRAADLGQPAVALTDHGAMYGTIPFYKKAKSAGVKPIIGLEGYMARRTMHDKENEDRKSFHSLLLAQNQTGVQNLFALATMAQLEGYYYKPRFDRDALFRHSEGIITTTGCLAGEVPQAILANDISRAKEVMGQYIDVFGRDRFYIELQDHNIPELDQVNPVLLKLAKEFDVKLLATNDVHYTAPGDGKAHDTLLCVQTNARVNDVKRMRMSGAQDYYLQDVEEMAKKFGHLDGALENTLVVAEMCNVNLDPAGYHLPIFDTPEDRTDESYLRELCVAGMKRKYNESDLEPDGVVWKRMEHELKIIHDMGFDTYFLIVWDICRFAEENDMWWNVRGSGAGSIVAYSLNITDVEPIGQGLIFERFLNPHRVSMPDIDMDFPDTDRHRIAEYIQDKYGREKVAQIITFGTMGAKMAVRDVGRAMDYQMVVVNSVASLIPEGKPKLKNMLDSDHDDFIPDLSKRYNGEADVKNLIDAAMPLEGGIRHASSHAAGVIIADKPLVTYLPLNKPTSKTPLGGIERVTQWPMDVVEPQVGLLKVDLLGLSTLEVMRVAARLIEERHGVKYTTFNIPYEYTDVGPDPEKEASALFDLIGRGETVGIFQLESAGMKKTVQQMQPHKLSHLVAAIALYRPGPMENIPLYLRRMHGEEEVVYDHPALEEFLADTYGIIVYQEQILQIASALASYDPADADMMRRAISKKKEKDIIKHRTMFIKGCVGNGISEAVAQKIYGNIEFFANYGFNRAHATDYGKVSAQTAFLKAHYPIEYVTALLAVERAKPKKVITYIAEAKRMGYTIAPPHINKSNGDFSIEDSKDGEGGVIRFGLDAVKNVGEGVIAEILKERENGEFKHLLDLAQRVNLQSIRKKTMECFAMVGAFDEWDTRSEMMGIIPQIVSYSQKHHANKISGQLTLFGGAAENAIDIDISQFKKADTPQLSDKHILAEEKELLGMYISSHPLDKWMEKLDQGYINAKIETLPTLPDGTRVVIAAIVRNVKHHYTKAKQKPMAFVQFEDVAGEIDSVVFPVPWARLQSLIIEDSLLIVDALTQIDEGGNCSLQVNNVTPIEEWQTLEKPVNNHLKETAVSADSPSKESERMPDRTNPSPSPNQPETSKEELRKKRMVSPPSPTTYRVAVPAPSGTANGNDAPSNGKITGKDYSVNHPVFRVDESKPGVQDIEKTAIPYDTSYAELPSLKIVVRKGHYIAWAIREIANNILPNFPGETHVVVQVNQTDMEMNLPATINCSPEFLETLSNFHEIVDVVFSQDNITEPN